MISNIERNIRFSQLTLEEYHELKDFYNTKLLESLKMDSNFIAIYEGTGTIIKPKAEIERGATELSKNSDKTIADFGKAVLRFLAKGAKVFDDLCLAISAVLTVGGIVLATCATVLFAILAFAVLVVPFAVLTSGLAKIDKSLGKIANPNKDKNVEKYKKLSKNIQAQVGGIKDINELEKIVRVSEALDMVKENPEMVAATESAEYCKLLSIIENRIIEENDDISLARISVCENLCPDYMTYEIPTMESNFMDDGTKLFMTLESIVSKPCLSGNGLLNSIIAISTEVCDKKTILEFLNCYKNTVNYELKDERYSDLPILKETDNCLNYVRECCSDLPEVLETCNQFDQLLGEIITECEMSVSEDASQFNPDPCSIGSLTPFPVAQRAVGDVVCDILSAESDDEITEAVLSFGRTSRVINENYYVMESSDNSGFTIVQEDLAKVARGAETKANEKFAKTATKDKSNTVGAAIKHAVDPMEKFVNDQYNKMKEKDANERRKIILAGGNPTPKILRWVKRGIKILIGGAIGTVVPVAALCTGIYIIGIFATDRSLDKKERAKIMKELEDEIQICSEKIDDSRGDEDKQKKYELMRIRNSLERQRDKIRYNLKY